MPADVIVTNTSCGGFLSFTVCHSHMFLLFRSSEGVPDLTRIGYAMAPNLVIYTWVAALALILVVYRRVRRFSAFHANRQQTGCFRAPKYPHTDPFFGCDLYKERQQALRAGNVQALYTRDFNRLGKTWVENFLGQCVINTMDAVNHQHIHNLGFEDFGKPPTRAKISAPILGNGIFMAEGAHWRQSRGIIKPIFSGAEVGNMAMMARHVDRLLALLPRDSRTFDIQPMLKKLV